MKNVQKNRKFAKGLVHGFGQKINVFFLQQFFGEILAQKIVFFNILDTKEYIKNIEKFANF